MHGNPGGQRHDLHRLVRDHHNEEETEPLRHFEAFCGQPAEMDAEEGPRIVKITHAIGAFRQSVNQEQKSDERTVPAENRRYCCWGGRWQEIHAKYRNYRNLRQCPERARLTLCPGCHRADHDLNC